MISILSLVVSALALMGTAYFVPGFRVKNFGHALLAALVIGIVNVLVRPFLILLTLPLNILTLGLFTFVVNAIVLKICAGLLDGVDLDGFGNAIVGAVILAILNALLQAIVF